jgi:hypothetical protein
VQDMRAQEGVKYRSTNSELHRYVRVNAQLHVRGKNWRVTH